MIWYKLVYLISRWGWPSHGRVVTGPVTYPGGCHGVDTTSGMSRMSGPKQFFAGRGGTGNQTGQLHLSPLQQDFQGSGATTFFSPSAQNKWFTLKDSLWKRSLEQTFFVKSKFMKDLGVLGLVFSKESLVINTRIPIHPRHPLVAQLSPGWSCRSVSVAVATSCRTSRSFVASVGRSGPQALGTCQRTIDAKLI